LQLYDNPLKDAGVRALLNSPNLTNLDALGVSGAGKVSTARMQKRFKKHAGLY